jgi:uncharacterized protein (DUF885 family)
METFMTAGEGARSELFAFADQYVDELAALDPIFATSIGVHAFDHLLPDFSSEQADRVAAHTSSALTQLEKLDPTDDLDRVAKEVMVERLTSQSQLELANEDRRSWGVLTSPLSNVRQAFELMPAATAADAGVLRERLMQVRPSLATWREGINDAIPAGLIPAQRHVLGVAAQARTYASGSYAELAARIAEATGADLEGSGLGAAAADADVACGELADWLVDSVAPQASEDSRCGLERYERWYRSWNGMELDAIELYEWGYQELCRIRYRMWTLAAVLAPDATTMAAVAAALDADESRAVHGADAMVERLSAFTEAAFDLLDGEYFDIDPRIRHCDVRIAPEGGAAAPHYIPPSDDLSRPGTTWLPTLGAERFSWWKYPSIWYHEAVPGHHLQCGTTILEADRLSRFHRLAGWTSGYGEGWALYAERLMDEIGAFSDPGDELGFLSGQALRAARIVVDMGLHLGLPAPDDLGVLGALGDCSGQVWSAEMAVGLLEEWAVISHEFAVSEVERYLSLPGQATSYKVGERAWIGAREAARDRLRDGFGLKRFHAYALGIGPMGLDTFRVEMSRWDGS